jgi:hypothetical protein
VVLYASQWQYPWLALFSLNNNANAPFLSADKSQFQRGQYNDGSQDSPGNE